MELEKETVVRGKHRKNKKMIKMANFCEGCGKGLEVSQQVNYACFVGTRKT